MRNFQFAEEIDFTRSKKKKHLFLPYRKWTLIQKVTVSILILMFLSVLLTLAIVFSW